MFIESVAFIPALPTTFTRETLIGTAVHETYIEASEEFISHVEKYIKQVLKVQRDSQLWGCISILTDLRGYASYTTSLQSRLLICYSC
ncbi:hypothetical protein BDZ91DRAFT_755203 [Kalaharituber pfeilii]|nr:hypothetical protein BDZ91DRAFT_755203 [Kalaharituber pfeilii]